MPTDLALANRAWESLMTAHAVLLRQFAAENVWSLNRLSMREYDVLYTLSKLAHSGTTSTDKVNTAARIGDLHRDVLLSQPALSRMVDRLAERGLVERVDDPTDGRAVRVQLSSKGRELQRTVGRAHARSVANAVSTALSDDEQRELARLATVLVEKAEFVEKAELAERAGGSARPENAAAPTAPATQPAPSQTQVESQEN